MQKKNAIVVGIGCGVAILVVIGISAVLFAPRLFEWGGRQFAAEQERRRLADNWLPPDKDAPPEEFFPPKIADYELDSHDKDASIPELRFDLSGRHAVYRADASQIHVFIYQASELEKEALFQRVRDAYEGQRGGMKRITNMGYRCYYSSSGHHQNHLWWIKGWLIVFRTDDTEDREPFVTSYFR